jgi:iron complex transport system permease protein
MSAVATDAPHTTGYRLLVAGLMVLVAIAFVVSLLTGPSGVGFAEGLQALLFGSSAEREATVLIMREIRLPRALLGALIGGVLGLSGAALQGYLRNPLAEPGLIGVSGGATFGAVLAIHTGAATVWSLALPIGGLLGAAGAVALVIGLAGLRSGPLTLILAGVAVTSFAGALTALALNLTRNPFATTEIMFWMLGSLSDRSMVHVGLAAVLIVPAIGLLLLLPRSLDALTLGEEAARSLGVDLQRTRNLVVAGTAMGVGAATAVAGSIAFVGLVVPHLLRPLVGHQPGRLLLPSLLGGMALVLAADVAVRLLRFEGELKLGVLTALIGAPFFFALVLRTRSELAV